MDGRLSEHALRARLDAGHQSIPWQAPQPAGFLAGIDFEAILASPDAKKIIRALPIQALYYGLKRRGMMECADVLKLLSTEQVTRVFDFDVWSKDELDRAKSFALLKAFAEGGSKQLSKRFVGLEEEYQLSILEGMLRVYDEDEFEGLSSSKQDQLYAMPCNKIFYEILSDDKELIAAIEQLLAAVIEHHLKYAYALIAHVSYHPPQEARQTLKQFRQARLEEEGYVSYEESLEAFQPFDRAPLVESLRSYRLHRRQGAVAHSFSDEQSFLDLVLRHARDIDLDIDEQYSLHQGFLVLANSLCSAARVEPEDLFGLNRVLEQAKSIVGLGLEYLSGSDIPQGLEVLQKVHAKTLFQVGLSLIDDVRRAVVEQFQDQKLSGASALHRYYQGRHWGAILSEFDRTLRDVLGFYHSEVLKGLFNRFPMAPKLTKDGERVQFVPVGNLAAFHMFANQVAGILACVRLASDMGLDSVEEDVERLVSSGFLNFTVHGEFKLVAEPKTLQAFSLLSEDQIRSRSAELFEKLLTSHEWVGTLQDICSEELIRQQLMQWGWQLVQQLLTAKAEPQTLAALVAFKGDPT